MVFLGFNVDAPHFQQSRIENAYALDDIIVILFIYSEIQSWRRCGRFINEKGSANFWKALDDSNDPHNIEKVQRKVGDEQPTTFSIENAKVKFDYDK